MSGILRQIESRKLKEMNQSLCLIPVLYETIKRIAHISATSDVQLRLGYSTSGTMLGMLHLIVTSSDIILKNQTLSIANM